MTGNWKPLFVKIKETGENKPIKDYRFNPELHKKLFFKNFWHNRIKPLKIDWHNPYLVAVVSGLIVLVLGTFILYLIFGDKVL